MTDQPNDTPEITTTPETAQGAAECQAARLDGEAAFTEFRASFTYPEFCAPTLQVFVAEKATEYHKLWYVWRGWCRHANRNPETGELTEAGRAAKEQAERDRRDADAVRETIRTVRDIRLGTAIPPHILRQAESLAWQELEQLIEAQPARASLVSDWYSPGPEIIAAEGA